MTTVMRKLGDRLLDTVLTRTEVQAACSSSVGPCPYGQQLSGGYLYCFISSQCYKKYRAYTASWFCYVCQGCNCSGCSCT